MAPVTVVRTPCKINVHLGVHTEKDSRGYHRVDSVMVPVDVYDVVRVSDAPVLEVCFSPKIGTAPEHTGVWRAAELLAAALARPPRVRIEVETHIPERAGLGGSSADAGATLRALARHWGVDAWDEKVVRVARRVGADVTFFLDPAPSLMVGAGDVLERVFPAFEAPLALVMPRATGGSTPQAYAAFDRAPVAPADPAAMCAALEEGDVAAVAAALANNLAPAARELCPEAGAVEDWLRARPGVLAAQITGSGTCSFALCATREAADAAAEDALTCGWRAWSTKTVGSRAEVC